MAGVLPYLPEVLFSRSARRSALRVARLMDGATSRFFGLECALGGDPAGRLGFLACVARTESAALARVPTPAGADPGAVRTWAALRRFAGEWDGPTGRSLAAELVNLWLEFDLHAATATRPPSVFLGPRELLGADRGPAVELLVTRLAGLTGTVPAPGAHRSLARCLARLPPGAGVFQAGLMRSRTPSPLRLCVTGLRPGHAVPYAVAAGWPGDAGRAAGLLARVGSQVDRVDVALDLADRVGPTLGLELSFVPKRRPAREPRWALLVDELVRTGLCERPVGDALLAYAGHAPAPAPSSGGPPAVLLRGLNHVKLTLRADGTLSAKAYLSVRVLPPVLPLPRPTGPVVTR
ncbi:hypothetical protein ABT354_31065 [Streptomyces sp. NPDC000594]|uniref:hypothetical protein n=1 Tax=Streptomyces sp. NPDC000594 TaxID=3154261 RepID=UPI0033273664